MMEPGGSAQAGEGRWMGTVTHEDLRRGDRPLLPNKDRFYLPPAGYEDASPGDILRSRHVELAFLGTVPQRFKAIQLLYRSTDLRGDPEAAVTTVVVPKRRDPELPCPIVSYQCAIDAVAPRCFPSYALRRGAKAAGALAQLELLLIAALLAECWAVSVPDHEGCQGMWGAPYEPGYRILDGVRAAFNCQRLGLSPSSPVGLWGYSGGGFASAWAAELSAGYAPELDIVGSVLGSPVADPGNVGRRLNNTFWAGLPGLVIAAMTQIYPEIERLVEQHATPEGKALLARLAKMTTAAAVFGFKHKDINDYMDITMDEMWELPEVKHILETMKLGSGAPTAPVLVVQAVNDRVISVDLIDQLVETYRAAGTSVTYHRDCFSEHLLLHTLSAPMTLRWLRDRFAGRPVSEHRVRTTWPTLFNPSTHRGMLRLGAIAARVATGRRIKRRPLSKLDAG